MTRSRFIAVLVALLAALGGVFWLLNRHQPPAGKTTVTANAPAPAIAPATAPITKSTAVLAPASPTSPIHVEASDSSSIGSLLADRSLDNKAVMAGLAQITLDSGRNLAERTEAMAHLLNLSVEDPAATLLPLVNNPRLPDSLCNQILDDALNDPFPWQADAYFAALTHRTGKEIQAKAREHLTFLVGTDYGDNLAEWSKAVSIAKEKWDQAAK